MIPPNPKCAWYNPLLLIPGTNAGAGKGVYSLAPLMEVLGVEKFFLILSAILCEERILFIADNIDTVSSAVHAVSAMLSPFQWQHLFLPILPSSLVAYTSSPFPFIIGIRRYQFTDQIKRALSDVIVVDADNGYISLFTVFNKFQVNARCWVILKLKTSLLENPLPQLKQHHQT